MEGEWDALTALIFLITSPIICTPVSVRQHRICQHLLPHKQCIHCAQCGMACSPTNCTVCDRSFCEQCLKTCFSCNSLVCLFCSSHISCFRCPSNSVYCITCPMIGEWTACPCGQLFCPRTYCRRCDDETSENCSSCLSAVSTLGCNDMPMALTNCKGCSVVNLCDECSTACCTERCSERVCAECLKLSFGTHCHGHRTLLLRDLYGRYLKNRQITGKKRPPALLNKVSIL